MAVTSCANSYNIQGTSNVSTLDGRMLYLKVLKNNDFKNIDSCDVVHGQFQFCGTYDTVRMANIFMDDESVIPVVIEKGDITIRLDNTQQTVSGTPLNDELFKFFNRYNQIKNQESELLHTHDRAIMNGSDMEIVNAKLRQEAMKLSEQEDKLVTTFVTDNFDNVLGHTVDRGYMEQGHRQVQERPLRKGLLREGAGESSHHEWHENSRTASPKSLNDPTADARWPHA